MNHKTNEAVRNTDEIERAQNHSHCRTYMLEGRGHMNFLTDYEKKMIVNFLLG